MFKLLSVLGFLVLTTPFSRATIIVAVGTKDGPLVCEDRRITLKSSNGQVSAADGNKAQQLGKFGVFAIAGDISGGMTNVVGRSYVTFDVLAEIPAFFKSHDVQQFNPQMAEEFEAHLWDELKKKSLIAERPGQVMRAQTEILLYWMDPAGAINLYILNLTGDVSAPADPAAPAAPHPTGHFVSLASFKTSRPLVRGKGLLGYNAIAGGTDPRFDDIRGDEELKPFLSHFVDASEVDAIAATHSMKKLIRIISERQDALYPGGLDVGPSSDCFLGTLNGIEYINQ